VLNQVNLSNRSVRTHSTVRVVRNVRTHDDYDEMHVSYAMHACIMHDARGMAPTVYIHIKFKKQVENRRVLRGFLA
jgi:hypothetical protein